MNADLRQYDTIELIKAIVDRMVILENGALEETLMRPVATTEVSELFGKLQDLLEAARAWRDGIDEDNNLPYFISALDDIVIPEPAVGGAPIAPGQLVQLGIEMTHLQKKYAALQGLYRTRLDVARRRIQELKDQSSPPAASSSP